MTSISQPFNLIGTPTTTDSGFVLEALWVNPGPNPVTSFTATWAVPPMPLTNHNDIVYLFPGMSPPDSSYILQPVLQYGDFNGQGPNQWWLNNWFVGAGIVPTPPGYIQGTYAPVAVGTIITGVMTCTGTSGGTYNYTSKFTGFPACDLAINNVAQATRLDIALECYGLASCSDYPNVIGTVWFNLAITTGTPGIPSTNVAVTPTWSLHQTFTDCGLGIIMDPAATGNVWFYY